MTADGLPYVGTSSILDGYLLAVGMCGQGFMLGPGVGGLLVRFIYNELTEDDQIILRQLAVGRASAEQEKLA